MKNGDIVTVKVNKIIETSGGDYLYPGSYTGEFIENGGVLHESEGAGVGDEYEVYRIPCVKYVDPLGCIFNLNYLDSNDIPSVPKTLIKKYVIDDIVGSQILYREIEI